jgi:ribosomal protein S12 methylthiotransferase
VKLSGPIQVGLVSLGCAKNLVDSEVMLGTLARAGMSVAEKSADADVIIINTCGFIEPAKRESVNAVLEAGKLGRPVIVAGCLPQRYWNELRAELPEVAAFIGLNEVPRIGEIVREVLIGRGVHARPGPAKYIPDFAAPRYRLTPRHWAYVKIAEGCDHPCAFCSIPRIRGRYRSRPLDDVLAEIRQLVAVGAREINLISQDTTLYGDGLCKLIRAAQKIPGDFWVRLLYTHPAHWSDELIETIAGCDKVCRYVDVPLQHINDRVLRRMRRETDGKFIRRLIGRIRAGIPGVAIRTAFIVGFPGETAAQFAELLAFIEETRFERLGVFVYWREDGTRAAGMDGHVPARVKRERYRRLMELQQKVSREVMAGFVGKRLRVLMDRPGIGRSHADAPEVDGTVRVRGAAKVGEFTEVEITGAGAYDLAGRTRTR